MRRTCAATRQVARPALLLALLGSLGQICACGALDESAPQRPGRGATCVTIEARLAPLVALAEAGKLKTIAHIVSHDLDTASQSAVLRLALDIGRALPPGTVQKLPALAAGPNTAALVPLVVAVLAPLPGNALAVPPIAPKKAELASFSAIASSCLTQDLFSWLTGLLRHSATAPALDTLLRGGTATLQQIQKAAQESGVEGRTGFVVLFRNLATTLANPDFDPRPLLATLGALRDPAVPGALDAVHALLAAATVDASGAPDPKKVGPLTRFMACARRLDPDARLPGHWYDVFVAVPLPAPPTGTASSTTDVLALAAFATQVLADSEGDRDALAQVLGLLLEPDRATAGIPELVGLLQSDALAGVVQLLGDLLLQPCRTPAG
ncbi:MAG: hypothetical protein EXR79_09320 [Myxococcales bacterium]|nr:hypothetical protein [Myxococcales bacterium]